MNVKDRLSRHHRLVIYFVGLIARCLVFNASHVPNNPGKSFLTSLPTFSTFVWNWNSYVEGKYLLDCGKDPYAGNSFHGSPIVLYIYSFFNHPWAIFYVLTVADLITSQTFGWLAAYFQRTLIKNGDIELTSSSGYSNVLSPSDINFPDVLAIGHWISPICLISCGALDYVPISSACTNISLVLFLRESYCWAAFAVAIATVVDFYCLYFIVPMGIYMWKKTYLSLGLFSGSFALSGYLVFQACRDYTGSWSFVEKFMLWMLASRDYRPNISNYWYMMQLIFSRFISLFTVVFHSISAAFVVPFYQTYQEHPLMVFASINQLCQLLRAAPTMASHWHAFMLLSCCAEIYRGSGSELLDCCLYMFYFTTIHTMWHNWMDRNGNANFMYFQVLAYNILILHYCTDVTSRGRNRKFRIQSEQEAKSRNEED